jgi:predicted permease
MDASNTPENDMRRRLLRSWLWKPSVQEEVDDELAFHLEMRTREYVDRGLAPEAAQQAALRRFGDLRRAAATCQRIGKERDRDMKRREYFAELRQDLVFGVRQLLKARGFATVAILTLALGIGATSSVFSTLYAVVLRPLSLPEPDRLLTVDESWRGVCCGSISVGNFLQWREQTTDVFDGLAAMVSDSFNLAEGATPERVTGLRVSGDYFKVMGTPPLLGQGFGPDADAPGREQVVVLSHRLWNRRFGADPAIVDRDIRMNGRPYRVAGVMPASFDLTSSSEELWVPAAFTPEEKIDFDRHYLELRGRLRAGMSVAQARSRVVAVGEQLVRDHPRDNATRGGVVRPFMEDFVSAGARASYWLLLGAVALVMLIACANVANLLVARGTLRSTELALRMALGAGRGRIVRQLLAESLLLAALGAGAGLILASVAIPAFVAWSPPGTPRLEQARLDPVTVGFTLLVSVLSALIFGLVPAWRAARPESVESLKTGRSGGLGARHDRLRTWLVATEVALVLVLLVSAGLLLRSAIAVQRVDPGFDPSGVIAGRVALLAGDYRDAGVVKESFVRLTELTRALPGVTAAAVVSQLPVGGGGMSNGLLPEGWAVDWSSPASSTIDTQLRIITPGYFETLRVPIHRGRGFTAADRAGVQKVMIVNEAFAARAWPNQNPLGKRVACCEPGPGGPMTPDWKIVVGVAGNVKWRGPSREDTPEFYLPLAQTPPEAWEWVQRTMFIAARTSGDAGALATPMRQTLAAIDPTLPLFDVRTMDDRLAANVARARFNTALLLILGIVGLLLALVGIYGVIAYFVSHRTQEIGVRLALGASPRDVVRLVVRQGLRPVLWGIAAGLALTFALTRLLSAALFGVTPRDPLTMAAVAIVLLLIALAASWLPARRATRIEPTKALQST